MVITILIIISLHQKWFTVSFKLTYMIGILMSSKGEITDKWYISVSYKETGCNELEFMVEFHIIQAYCITMKYVIFWNCKNWSNIIVIALLG